MSTDPADMLGPTVTVTPYQAAAQAYQGQCWVPPNDAGLRAAVNAARRPLERALQLREVDRDTLGVALDRTRAERNALGAANRQLLVQVAEMVGQVAELAAVVEAVRSRTALLDVTTLSSTHAQILCNNCGRTHEGPALGLSEPETGVPAVRVPESGSGLPQAAQGHTGGTPLAGSR